MYLRVLNDIWELKDIRRNANTNQELANFVTEVVTVVFEKVIPTSTENQNKWFSKLSIFHNILNSHHQIGD